MRSTREYHANLCHQSLKMEQKEKQNKVDLSTTGKGHFIMQETMVIMLFNGRIWYMNLFFLFKQFCHSVPLGTCKHCQSPTLASHKLKFSQHSDYIDFSFWTLGKRNRDFLGVRMLLVHRLWMLTVNTHWVALLWCQGLDPEWQKIVHSLIYSEELTLPKERSGLCP